MPNARRTATVEMTGPRFFDLLAWYIVPMSDATPTTTAPDDDPTLSTLIPQRSIRRNVLLAAGSLLLLAGVWASAPVLRPSVVGQTSAAASTVLAGGDQVLTMVELTPQGWPNVGVQSVADLPGAKVTGAWVLPGAFVDPPASTNPANYAKGVDYLRASFPHRRFDATSELPQRLTRGEPAQLFILWDITACSALTEGQRPQIELTSILRTSTHELLLDYAGPFLALDAGAETGACPTG
jgi:hypothetical protein